MYPFSFSTAQNEPEAIASFKDGVKYIAGGTNLIDLMKLTIEQPSTVIDINKLDLQKIEWLSNGNVKIGSLVRNSDLAYDKSISQKYPVLSQALLSGASPQLRNMATVGGNMLQRTRCPYFYDTVFACNKRAPGSGCAAMTGYNRSHAIVGTSNQCIATHPSDMCVALTVLDTIVYIQSATGNRVVPFKDFHLLPGQTPEKETVLLPGELITAIEIPYNNYATRSCYLKVRDRASYDFALASAAVILKINNNHTIEAAHIALGGIGTKPWRAIEAEKLLVGKSADNKNFTAAAAIALKDARLHEHNTFKKELAKRTIVKALTTATSI
jgi:xanthine dehydrogenase YagS FAD-binding subunit